MGITLSSNTTEALLNHASETGQWHSSAQNMSGNPTLYKAALVRHPFRIFSFSKKPITKTTHRDLHAAADMPSLPLLCSGELWIQTRMTHDCLSCAEPIESSDGHESSVFFLGRAHAEVALGGSDCPHCGDMSLLTLRLRVAIVQGDELTQLTLPRSSSAASFEPRRKVPRVSDADLSGSGDEPAPAQCPSAPYPPTAGPLPVRFMTADLRPSPDAQDVVSFGAMEGTVEEEDAISVAASAREEWSNSPLDYTAPHGSVSVDLHHSDVELLSVLTPVQGS